MPGFLPSRDSLLLAWSSNFDGLVAVNFADYGLSSAQATAYTAAHTAFASSLGTATEPSTRTKVSIAQKDAMRAALKFLARDYSRIIQGIATVTDAQKYALGLNVRATPTPVPPPVTSPTIDLKSVFGRTVTIRLHGEDSLRRARPAGVKGATVMSWVGETPPESPSAWTFQGSTTKIDEIIVEFPLTVSTEAKVWITAFWFNAKSQSGPAATPVSTYLNRGGMAAAA
jgi:hypothetical protein